MERWYTLASWSFHVARTSFRSAPAAFQRAAELLGSGGDDADVAKEEQVEKMLMAATAVLSACSRLFCVAAILDSATVRARLAVWVASAPPTLLDAAVVRATSRSATGSWQRSATRRRDWAVPVWASAMISR